MTLEDACWKNKMFFQMNLLGNFYCKLSLNRKIDCSFLGEMDKNGLYRCKSCNNSEYLKSLAN
jgi:hypothetical protein